MSSAESARRIKGRVVSLFQPFQARRILYSLIYGARLAPIDRSLSNRVRGLFEEMEYTNGTLTVSGWMLLAREPLDAIWVDIDKERRCQAQMRERDDLAAAFPFITHAHQAGFTASLPIRLAADALLDINLVAEVGGEPVGSMAAWYSTDVAFRIPPAELIKRVTGSDNRSFFCSTSFQTFRDLWDVVSRWRDPASIRSMLDWGCGCGRALNTFRSLSGVPCIHGCDIDRDTIEWCRANFDDVQFSVIPSKPPTTYADNAFDLIIGNSVLSHLTKDLQLRWLEEMSRILAPGGLCLASVLGEFATSFSRPDSRVRYLLERDGLFDEWKDASLEGVAPAGYYRDTLQTQAYTRHAYGKYFEIVDYIEGGWLKFQDLVVMRKR
jgi:SAM-dependent methyltransferase